MAGAYLEITAGPAAGLRIPIGDELTIGRASAEFDGLEADEELSRRHARVVSEGGRYLIEDLGSLNGTFVNERKIQRIALTPQDVVRIGGTQLRLAGESELETSDTWPDSTTIQAIERLRSQFPMLAQQVYADAARRGPVPEPGLAAARAALAGGLDRTGSAPGTDPRIDLRQRFATLFRCWPDELALTGGATDAVSTIIWGIEFNPGDQILTSNEESAPLYATLHALHRRAGVEICAAPLEGIASAITARTRLVACSHVGRVSGRVADTAAIAQTGCEFALDGTFAAGAIPVEIGRLGCDYYAADARAWLCGPPAGVGVLYVRAHSQSSLLSAWPGDASVQSAGPEDEPVYERGARRFDTGRGVASTDAWARASLTLLEGEGWESLAAAGVGAAARLAAELRDGGCEILPRGESAIVSWRSEDPAGEAARLAVAGVHVSPLPDEGAVRASLGAWSTSGDVDQLAAAVTESR